MEKSLKIELLKQLRLVQDNNRIVFDNLTPSGPHDAYDSCVLKSLRVFAGQNFSAGPPLFQAEGPNRARLELYPQDTARIGLGLSGSPLDFRITPDPLDTL